MKISDTSKYLIRNIIILFFVEVIIGFIALFIINKAYIVGYALGLVLGTLSSVIRIIMLDFSAKKVIDMDKKAATVFFKYAYFLRVIVLIIFMFVIFYNHPTINLYAGILGILNMPLVVYMYKLFFKKGGMGD